ncbi:MAG: ABC transporter permease [Anaerolineae bacterium]|nr:ABC transporter permease [Anaerolineae bacterium]
MTALMHHFTFEFKTGLRNSTLLLMNYLFPLGFYAMMGLVMTQINPLFAETMIPAMVIFSGLVSTLLGMPGPLVESREAGIFRSYKINGVPAAAILLMPALTTVFHVLIVAVLIGLTGAPLFDGSAPTRWVPFALVTLVTVLSSAGTGSLISVIARDSRAVVLVSQLVFLPSMLIGGLMIPLDVLPSSVRPFAFLLPASHAMQAYLGFAYEQTTLLSPWIAVAVLGASGLIGFGLAIYLFNWDSKNEAQRGHPAMALLALIPNVIAALLML